MPHLKNTAKNEHLDATLRIQVLVEPEIQSYISSLKNRHRGYRMPLEKGRKLIDEAMATKTLTGVLYEAREQEAV